MRYHQQNHSQILFTLPGTLFSSKTYCTHLCFQCIFRGMCGRQYRVYRCGHRIIQRGITYCRNARISPNTGKWTMCGLERTVTDVAEDRPCGDSDCYIEDLVEIGWKCCECSAHNYYNTRFCKGVVLIGRNQSPVECQHYVCAGCRYA